MEEERHAEIFVDDGAGGDDPRGHRSGLRRYEHRHGRTAFQCGGPFRQHLVEWHAASDRRGQRRRRPERTEARLGAPGRSGRPKAGHAARAEILR